MRMLPPNPLVTRADLREAFGAIEAPLLARWRADAAGPDLGVHRALYDLGATRLEPVARYLWGLVPHTAGGGESRGWSLVLDAVAHGTDPEHPQYWGAPGEKDQRSVEMAAFGLALSLTRERIWDPLSPQQKDRLAGWLTSMLTRSLAVNNWQFFRLMVTTGLRSVGRAPADVDAIEATSIAMIDSYHRGEGWYSDGAKGCCDYYCPMAFHFYGPMLSRMVREGPIVERLAEWKGRARAFAEDHLYWFSRDGAALPYGRSLTYRFAQASYWGASAVAGIDALSPGELKGLLLRHFRWWWKRPILDADGVLSLGYTYPNHNILEPYNAWGSPYWALKAMSVLMLADDHPFWAEPEKPLPARPARKLQRPPRFLSERDDRSGHVLTLSAGQYYTSFPLRHRDAKYSKLVYHTFFGPCMGTNHEWLSGAGIDGTLSVQIDDPDRREGQLWLDRGRSTAHTLSEDFVASDWSPLAGVTVRSWLVPTGDGAWHVRVHRVVTDKPILLAEGGFAADEPAPAMTRDDRVLAVSADGSRTGLIDLTGGRKLELTDVEPNASLLHSRARVPTALATLAPGTHWLATTVLGAAPGSAADAEQPPKVTLKPGDSLALDHAGRHWSIPLTP